MPPFKECQFKLFHLETIQYTSWAAKTERSKLKRRRTRDHEEHESRVSVEECRGSGAGDPWGSYIHHADKADQDTHFDSWLAWRA